MGKKVLSAKIKQRETTSAHSHENSLGKQEAEQGFEKDELTVLSCRCKWTFTTAEHPVDSNYLTLFSSLPVVAVSLVRDDNYTPLTNPRAPYSLILSLSPPSRNLSPPLPACVSQLQQGRSPTNANNTLTHLAQIRRKWSVVLSAICILMNLFTLVSKF